MKKAKVYPETTIEADIKVTFIINDQMDKMEATSLIHDILDGADFDDLQVKNIKVFHREVKK